MLLPSIEIAAAWHRILADHVRHGGSECSEDLVSGPPRRSMTGQYAFCMTVLSLGLVWLMHAMILSIEHYWAYSSHQECVSFHSSASGKQFLLLVLFDAH